MGEVWLAEQSRPLRRQVALKIIKAGLDTAQVVARFQAERQALALMDHPAIAKVFDAGSTAEGRPYFAMEYVRGESLTAYCDRQRLTIPERLDLFTHLCDGVQHAHQKGIIHRDLKPSNVLVTTQDDRPAPKIIDFGIAKATSQPLTDHTLHTALGGVVGTLEYMSPEQAELGGIDIDTRSDVYALGVILYELLTGVLPVDRRLLLSSGLDEVRRTIREVDPPRPSTRVTQEYDTADAAARKRGTEPTRLAGQLRGDLDWITLKALEKDRARRYATVNELAADVRRHLKHEPVIASPPSAIYRLKKFVRRNRLPVAAAAMLVVMLGIFAATMAFQARRISRERDRANVEAATARQVSDFLTGLFKVADPNEAKGNTLTAREILDAGVANIETDLAGQPEVRGRLLVTMGAIYTNLGLYAKAEQLLAKAVETQRREYGSDHQATLAAMHELGNAYWFQDKHAQAEQLYLEVIERRGRTLGTEHIDTLRASNDLASLYVLQRRFDEAERLTRATLATQERSLGADHQDTRLSLNILQNIYYVQGRYSEAEPISREALAKSRKTLGDEHPETLVDLHNLATLQAKLGRYDDAERLFLNTIATMRRVNGSVHRYTVNSIQRLAEMYREQRRFAEAESQLTSVLTALELTPGGTESSRNSIVTALAELYEAWNKPAKAAEWRAKLPR
jgi:non-specific serine/threonine protein kinase/serine/threonine-protein kinase